MFKSLIRAMGLILILAVAAPADDLSGLMPETIGDMRRIELVVGDEAQAEVNELHGKALAAKASCIARYARSGDAADARPAEVWVSRVESEQEARRQTGLMVHKMYENPRSPFKNPGRLDQAERSVYRFDGMGQTHLIWFSGDLVYWVSAAPDDQQTLLDVLCK